MRHIKTGLMYSPLSEWISVDDRLPETREGVRFEPCLAVHAGWDNFPRLLMFDTENQVFTRDGDDVQKTTHWMPLPEPPK